MFQVCDPESRARSKRVSVGHRDDAGLAGDDDRSVVLRVRQRKPDESNVAALVGQASGWVIPTDLPHGEADIRQF